MTKPSKTRGFKKNGAKRCFDSPPAQAVGRRRRYYFFRSRPKTNPSRTTIIVKTSCFYGFLVYWEKGKIIASAPLLARVSYQNIASLRFSLFLKILSPIGRHEYRPPRLFKDGYEAFGEGGGAHSRDCEWRYPTQHPSTLDKKSCSCIK